MTTKGTCVVSDFECRAPAGWGTASGYAEGDVRVTTKCSSCKEFVCSKCSTGRGKTRLCDICHRDMVWAAAAKGDDL